MACVPERWEVHARMPRGVDIDIHLTPGIPDENFVAEALGNLAAYQLESRRGETLQWQVLRVEESGRHHFRLVIRHPDRILDVGLAHDLRDMLDRLSQQSQDELRAAFHRAQRNGLVPVRLRHVRETPDLWQDDFWNWIG